MKTGDFAGRLLLIDFWAPGCAPCLRSLPALADLHTRLNPEGLEVIAVAVEGDEARVRGFLENDRGVPFPVALDPDGGLMERVALSDVPSWIVLDAFGRLVHRSEGADPRRVEWVVRRGLEQLRMRTKVR